MGVNTKRMSMLEGKLGMIAGVAAAAAGVVGIGAAALWLTEEEDEETEQDTVNDGSKSPRKDAAAAAAPRDSKIFAIIDPVERAMKQILSAAEFAKFKALPQPESLAGIQAWEAQLQPFIQDEARQQAFVAAYEREQALRQIFDAQLAVKKEIAGEYKKYLTEENCKVFDAKMAAIETDGPTPEATWFDGLDDWLVENVTDFEASWSAVTDANAHALFAKKGEEVEVVEAVEEVPEVSRADSDELFDKFDADDSGGLDLDELLEMIAEVKHADKAELQTEEIKKAWDADGDGSVTKYEFHQRLIRMREAKPELFEQFLRAMLEVTAEDLMEM